MAVSLQAKRYAANVVKILKQEYPDVTCALHFSNPLELLVATILSAQCTDQRVNVVTKDLFRKYPSAADYAAAPLEELEKDIQSTGFFRNKAKCIKAACETIARQFGGKVPREMPSLVELPGVGRKTANVVLGTAYEIASGIVVDTHVTRLSRRMGLTKQKDAVKIELELMSKIPSGEWIMFSHRMIHHGRRICTARKPKCGECPLGEICPRIGVEKES
ncbi:MAG: endonuclease III [Thermoguttaceae bacterium]|jgi:endonuclease-3